MEAGACACQGLSFRGLAAPNHPFTPQVAGPRNLASGCLMPDAAARAKIEAAE